MAAALLIGGASWAQSAQLASGEGEGFLGYRRALVWREPAALASTGVEPATARAQLGSAELGGARFDVGAEADALAALLLVEPPAVTRATLDGAGEELQRFHGLPGGIVLGLEASVGAELAAACAGARLEGTPGSGLALRLADGRRLALPGIAAEELGALLEFRAGGSDALVDLHGPWVEPRLAPALAHGPLADELVRLDRVPHTLRPETRAWKTLIVDRAVRVEASGNALRLAADLEVRLYAPEDARAGWAVRGGALEAAGAGFVGPRTEADLGTELAPLAELAGWLGFLRWAERLDPRGMVELRAAARAGR